MKDKKTIARTILTAVLLLSTCVLAVLYYNERAARVFYETWEQQNRNHAADIYEEMDSFLLLLQNKKAEEAAEYVFFPDEAAKDSFRGFWQGHTLNDYRLRTPICLENGVYYCDVEVTIAAEGEEQVTTGRMFWVLTKDEKVREKGIRHQGILREQDFPASILADYGALLGKSLFDY